MKQHKYSKRKLAKKDAQYKRMRDELMYPTSDGNTRKLKDVRMINQDDDYETT